MLSESQFHSGEMPGRPDRWRANRTVFSGERHNGQGNMHDVGFAVVKHPLSRNFEPMSTLPGQQMLFDHEYEPPKLDGLGVTPGGEHLTTRLMGLAADHSLRKWGRLPEPSSDLSSHSLPIVEKFARKGLINMPEDVDHNGLKKGSHDTNSWVREGWMAGRDRPVDSATVSRASNLVRGALRSPRKNRNLGEQLNLPGV